MKPIFKNTTKYSKEIYMKFLEFHNQKYGLKHHIYSILFIILLAYCIIINVQHSNLFPAIFFGIVLILVIYNRYFSQFNIVKKELNSEPIKKENQFTFYFYEKYFKIRNKQLNYKVKYKELYKLHETDEYFYLYIDHTHSYILNKNGFTMGEPENFQKFIKSKKLFL